MEYIIKNYVDNLKEKDIINFAKKRNIDINNEEIKIIYLYIKNYWLIFYKGNPNELLMELKEKLRPTTYEQLIKLYKEYFSKMKSS